VLGKAIYAVDFGIHQPLALPCLTRLREAGCHELILLHVTRGERGVRGVPDLLREDVRTCVKEAAARRLEEWKQSCIAPGLSVRAMTEEADLPWLAVCDCARREGATLLVLGPKGNGHPGSMAYFIMHANPAHAALLILKTNDTSGRHWYGDSCSGLFSKILLATDWSPCASRAEECVAQLCGAGVEKVVVAHVADLAAREGEPSQHAALAERRLAESCRNLEKAGIKTTKLVLSGDPVQAIAKAAGDEGVSLIALGSTGKSVSLETAIGSVSEQVTLIADTSVLLVH
jgi:nucleotide-binding universal stress UspA family protein